MQRICQQIQYHSTACECKCPEKFTREFIFAISQDATLEDTSGDKDIILLASH